LGVVLVISVWVLGLILAMYCGRMCLRLTSLGVLMILSIWVPRSFVLINWNLELGVYRCYGQAMIWIVDMGSCWCFGYRFWDLVRLLIFCRLGNSGSRDGFVSTRSTQLHKRVQHKLDMTWFFWMLFEVLILLAR